MEGNGSSRATPEEGIIFNPGAVYQRLEELLGENPIWAGGPEELDVRGQLLHRSSPVLPEVASGAAYAGIAPARRPRQHDLRESVREEDGMARPLGRIPGQPAPSSSKAEGSSGPDPAPPVVTLPANRSNPPLPVVPPGPVPNAKTDNLCTAPTPRGVSAPAKHPKGRKEKLERGTEEDEQSRGKAVSVGRPKISPNGQKKDKRDVVGGSDDIPQTPENMRIDGMTGRVKVYWGTGRPNQS